MRHELWSDGSAFSFFPVCNRQGRTLVEPGATLIWIVDAPHWVTACIAYHEFQGWEPYKPMDGDPGTYTAEQEAEARQLVQQGGRLFPRVGSDPALGESGPP